MGYKEWQANEKLTAADVNALLMKQSVISCTATTLPANYPPQPGDADLTEGTVIYRTDTDWFQVWHEATGWQVILWDDPGWQPVTFANGWTNYGAGYASGAYRAGRDGRVDFGGLLAAGTVAHNTVIATFPTMYAPSESLIFMCMTGNVSSNPVARVDVTPAGELRIIGNGNPLPVNWLDLSAIRY
ncbi:MAG: hypothetical protein ACOYY2_13020 [Actinomycetota bacterium]